MMRLTTSFYQIEGLVVDKHITMSDLKGTLAAFAKEMFGGRPYASRPSYFPFTEPSLEVDISASNVVAKADCM